MHSNYDGVSTGPKSPHLSIVDFFYQLLNFQRIFNKKEKIRTNENSISLYFIYNYTQTKITYNNDTYLNNKENKEHPISID